MQTTAEPVPRPQTGAAPAVEMRRVDEVIVRMRDGVELAEAGYGTVLVDCRGTGASRGHVAAAATAGQEALDGYDVVEWTAGQSWCSGAVGVWGMSYGGALALATAAIASGPEGMIDYDVDPTAGAVAGLLDPLGIGVGYPLDQGPDERASLCFTSPPWSQDVELAGSPVLELWVEVPAGAEPPEVMLSAKLSDVAPDGSSTLITRGWTAGCGMPAARVSVSRAHPEKARLEADAQIHIVAPSQETVTVQARGRHSRTTMAYEGTVGVGDRVTFAHTWQTAGDDEP